MLSECTSYLLINFISENMIGYLKSMEELKAEIKRYSEILEMIVLERSRFLVVFAQSR